MRLWRYRVLNLNPLRRLALEASTRRRGAEWGGPAWQVGFQWPSKTACKVGASRIRSAPGVLCPGCSRSTFMERVFSACARHHHGPQAFIQGPQLKAVGECGRCNHRIGQFDPALSPKRNSRILYGAVHRQVDQCVETRMDQLLFVCR